MAFVTDVSFGAGANEGRNFSQQTLRESKNSPCVKQGLFPLVGVSE